MMKAMQLLVLLLVCPAAFAVPAAVERAVDMAVDSVRPADLEQTPRVLSESDSSASNLFACDVDGCDSSTSAQFCGSATSSGRQLSTQGPTPDRRQLLTRTYPDWDIMFADEMTQYTTIESLKAFQFACKDPFAAFGNKGVGYDVATSRLDGNDRRLAAASTEIMANAEQAIEMTNEDNADKTVAANGRRDLAAVTAASVVIRIFKKIFFDWVKKQIRGAVEDAVAGFLLDDGDYCDASCRSNIDAGRADLQARQDDLLARQVKTHHPKHGMPWHMAHGILCITLTRGTQRSRRCPRASLTRRVAASRVPTRHSSGHVGQPARCEVKLVA